MIPQYLYQYTTVESLIAILKSGKIRFTRLDKMNDPLEGLCGEFAELKKTVYVSSWTAESEESIPMWSMYARNRDTKDLSQGVRIKMPINLFTADEYGKLRKSLSIKQSDNGRWDVESLIDPVQVGNVNKLLADADKDYGKQKISCVDSIYGPSEVRYVSLGEFVLNCRQSIEDDSHKDFKRFKQKVIGLEKIKDWAYEKEFRFWFQFPKFKLLVAHENVLKKYPAMEENGCIDIPFNKEAIKEMEITLGPNYDISKYSGLMDVLESVEYKNGLRNSAILANIK